MGIAQDGSILHKQVNSMFSIVNSLITIGQDLQRVIPIKIMEKAIGVYRSINVDMISTRLLFVKSKWNLFLMN